MAQARLRQLLLGVATSGLLMGCVAGTGGGTGDGTTSGAPAATRGTGREVEAPDVFQTTDSALWDGRPSLGGIWVASPDAVDPERVMMFNPATGKSVAGALFRRERDNPGPRLQVSSDAAEALGMLAGQPTELRVTALRREEPVPEVPVEAALSAESADEMPAEAEGQATDAAEPTEAAALAAAALAATGAASEVATEPADAATDPAMATEEPAKRKTWKERRAEAKAQREAEKAAAAAAAAAAAEAESAPAEPVDPAASAVAEVETAPLDTRTPEVAAAEPVVEARPPATDAPAATGPVRTIQIASFSKEENANRAVEALSKIGITARAARSERNGTAFWGVVAAGDAALLARIRDAGFADAYFLQ